ncbi:MAG: GNAT family N-acetyltransferase [Brevefilum sp.]|nr:GNAT family N-acetyltransferase [Brevefilum sp.]
MKTNEIFLESKPEIDGLRFRNFLGEQDFPGMMVIIEAAAEADHQQTGETLEDLKHDYAHLTNSDPYQDVIIAEIFGDPIAYARVEWWQEEDPNDRIYGHFLNILPKWRGLGIETSIIRWCEARLQEIAAEHPQDSQRFFQTYSNEFKVRFNTILESLEYTAERFFIEMSRTLEDIPSAELPQGIQARPVQPGEERKIWDASIEAFRDHWGYAEPKEEHFTSYAGSKYFQPDLWQVAWDGDQVVSSVMNYIDHDYNKKYHRQRGWTENISTLKPWRHRGIARTLIVRSMHMHKAKGMNEVGLGVDTNNPNGALKLYQGLGYQQDKTFINYRKPM